MTNRIITDFDIDAEINKFFDGSSNSAAEPCLMLICGGVCSGKTTFRRQRYSVGYVVLDAAEIFLALSHGTYFDFPDGLLEPMDLVGKEIAKRAVQERRNIVAEMIGNTGLEALCSAFKALSYRVEGEWLTCDVETALQRNQNRSKDNISSVYTEEFHLRWLMEAIKDLH